MLQQAKHADCWHTMYCESGWGNSLDQYVPETVCESFKGPIHLFGTESIRCRRAEYIRSRLDSKRLAIDHRRLPSIVAVRSKRRQRKVRITAESDQDNRCASMPSQAARKAVPAERFRVSASDGDHLGGRPTQMGPIGAIQLSRNNAAQILVQPRKCVTEHVELSLGQHEDG